MSDLLTITLSASVPLRIEEMKRVPIDTIMARAPELAQVIAEKGDVIQFKSNRPGETARAFNALAEAIAALSFFPGGVDFAGMHFEAEHPEMVR